MRCNTIRKSFPGYLDDAIASGKRRRIEAHLTDCERCRDELRGYERLDRELRLDRMRVTHIAESLEGGDHWDIISKRLPGVRDRQFVRVPRSIALAALLVLGIGIGLAIPRVRPSDTGEQKIVLEIRNINSAYDESLGELIDLVARYDGEQSNTKAILTSTRARNERTFDELIELLGRYEVTPEQLESITRWYVMQYETLRAFGDSVRGSIIDG